MPINEYEDLATNLFTKPEEQAPGQGDSYEAEIDGMKSTQKQELQGSMYVAQKQDPQRQAEVIKLSNSLNMPVDIVDRQFDSLKGQSPDIDYDSMIEENPSLSKFLQDPKNAAVSHDDLDSLKGMENVAKAHKFDNDLANELAVGFANLGSGIAKIPALYESVVNLPAEMIRKRIEERGEFMGLTKENIIPREELLASGRGDDFLRNNPVTQKLEDLQKNYSTPNLDKSITDEIGKGNYSAASRAMVAQVLSNAPQQLLNISMALSGAGAAGLAVAGATSGAQALDEAQDAGADPVAATTNALVTGGVEAAFESLGTFGILKHWEGAIAKQYGKQVAKEVMKDFGKTLIAATAGEANEEFLTSLAQDASKALTGVDKDAMKGSLGRALDAGIVGGFSGGTMTAPSAIASGVRRSSQFSVEGGVPSPQKQLTIAERGKLFYLSFGKAAESSKLRERLPEAQKQYVDEIAKNNGVENVYIPIDEFESYWQKKGVPAVKAAQDMGISKQFDESVASGTDIVVPFGTFTEKTVGTEHYEGMADSVKFSSDALTVNQAKVQAEAAKAEVKQADIEATEKAATEEQKINEVVAQVSTLLRDAGLDAKQAPLLRGIATLALREGMEPQALLDSLNLQIGRGETTQAEGEAQAAQAAVGPMKRLSQAVSKVFNQGQKPPDKPNPPTREEFVDFLKSKGKTVVRGQLIYDGMLKAVGAPPEMIERLREFNKPENDPARKILEVFQPRIFNQDVLSPDKQVTVTDIANVAAKAMGIKQTPIGFVSGVEAAVLKMDLNASPAKDLKNRITNLAGIKKDEIEYLGLNEFLDAKGSEKISKEELLNFIRSNGVQVEQVVLSEDYVDPNRGKPKKDLRSTTGEVFIDDVQFNTEYVDPDEDEYDRERDYYLYESDVFEENVKEGLEEKKTEIRTELESEHTDDDGNIDEEALDKAVEEATSGNWEDTARQEILEGLSDLAYDMAVDSVKENNDVHEITETNTGYSLRWSRGRGTQEIFHNDHYVEDLGDTPRDEAQAQSALTDWLIENGKVATDRSISEDKVTWGAPVERGSAGKRYELIGLENISVMEDFSDPGSPEFWLETPDDSDKKLYVDDLDGAKAEAIKLLKESGSITEAEVKTEAEPEAPDVNKATGKAKFKSYKVDGGTNYREILLTLPKNPGEKFVYSPHFGKQENIVAHVRLTDRVDADGKKVLFVEEIQSDWHQQGRERGYTGSEKDEAAQQAKLEELAEAREIYGEQAISDRTDLIELLGSVGNLGFNSRTEAVGAIYKNEDYATRWDVAGNAAFVEKADSYRKNRIKHEKILKEIEDLQSAEKTVPDAPFKNTEAWAALAMKRVMRMAVEQGYDVVAISPASVHVERWGTDSVSWAKKGDHWLVGSVEQVGGRADGMNIEEMARQRGNLLEKGGVKVTTKEELTEVIRETLNRERNDRSLESLTESVWKQMQSTDSGVKAPRKEGMEFFYDNVLPRKVIPDILKKLDKAAKVKVGEIEAGNEKMELPADLTAERAREISNKNPENFKLEKFATAMESSPEAVKSHAENLLDESDIEKLGGALAPSKVKTLQVEITPAMKEAILQGQTLFQKDDTETPRGQIRFGKEAIRIDILEKADASTFIHETGHLYLELLSRLAKRDGATSETKNDVVALLKWFNVSSIDDIGTEQHEMFARGFERFLGEGKAPSKALKKVFNRFKMWIMSVYQDLDQLNVTLTDDVRDVMGRMLMSENEINKTTVEMNYTPLFGDPAAVGMNQEQAMKYREAQAEAQDFAKQQIMKELMAEANEQKSAAYEAKKAQLRIQIEQDVNAAKVYNTISILQRSVMADGSPVPDGTPEIKLDPSSVHPEERKLLPKGIWDKKTGLHPNIAAEVLGYPGGDNLLDNIKAAPPKEDLIERMVRKEMLEKYPGLTADPAVVKERTFAAVHNERRAEVLQMELEYLAVNAQAVLKDAVRRVVRRVPPKAVVRQEAENIIGSKNLEDIKPHIYRNAEVKASREAGAMLTKGDIDGAFKAKQKELLNHELYRAATEARENVNKSIKGFKKMFKGNEETAKNRDVDMVNAARAVLSEFGLGPETQKSVPEYLDKIKQYDPETYNVVMTLVNAATENAGLYKKVSYDDFADMSDAVNALWELSKNSKEMQIAGKKVTLEQAKLELQDQLAIVASPEAKPGMQKAVTPWEKTKMRLLAARAALTRVEHWVDAVDLGHGGPFRKYIWQPISEAVTQYRLSKKEVMEDFKKILTDHAKSITPEVIESAEIGYTFKNKAELLMAILHTGNQSNKDKLIRGRNWGTISPEGILDSSRWDAFIARAHNEGILTKQDYGFAQKIWNLMEAQKPGAQRAHKSIYGYYFNEITANDVVTPFGVYRGGYIPAKVDVYTNEDSKIRQDREAFEQNNNSFQFPTTGRGFTKSRVDDYVAPLSLDLSLLAGHIDSVLRFTHIEPRVKEVARIVNDKEFRAKLAELDSEAGSEMLIPWLQRSATQRTVLPSEDGISKLLDPVAKFLRKSVAMQMMVGNVTNSLQQFTGLVVAMSKVKPKHIRNGLVTYILNPSKTTEAIMDKSDFMASTQGSNIYEIQQAIEEVIVNPSTFESMQAFAAKHTYFLQSATQNIVNGIVWTGAYEQAIEAGVTDAEAVQQADSAVRLTQGTTNAEDISRHQVGTATKGLFTQFVGYFNLLTNLTTGETQKIAREVGLRKGAGKMFYLYMTAFMLPAVLSEFIVKAMAGGDFDDDDDGYANDMLAAFFGSQFKTATAMIPFAGPVATAAYNRFNDQQYDDRLSLSPVVSVIESSVGVPADVYKILMDDKHLKKKTVKDALMLIGTASSLPIGPIGKPVGYLMDVEEGKTQPTGPVDFARGLVTGKGPR